MRKRLVIEFDTIPGMEKIIVNKISKAAMRVITAYHGDIVGLRQYEDVTPRWSGLVIEDPMYEESIRY